VDIAATEELPRAVLDSQPDAIIHCSRAGPSVENQLVQSHTAQRFCNGRAFREGCATGTLKQILREAVARILEETMENPGQLCQKCGRTPRRKPEGFCKLEGE
jgi:hypothetical protein